MPYQLPPGLNGQTTQVLPWNAALQTVAFDSSSSTQSSAVGVATRIVVLYADADCYVAIGASPTAASSGACFFLATGHYIHHPIGSAQKVAARGVSDSGNLRVMEVPSDE